jgi:hypothetical protein
MKGRQKVTGILALAVVLEMAIGVANSAFHWHSIVPLFALTAIFFLALATAVVGVRSRLI